MKWMKCLILDNEASQKLYEACKVTKPHKGAGSRRFKVKKSHTPIFKSSNLNRNLTASFKLRPNQDATSFVTTEDKEKEEEAIASLAAAAEISVDAAIAENDHN